MITEVKTNPVARAATDVFQKGDKHGWRSLLQMRNSSNVECNDQPEYLGICRVPITAMSIRSGSQVQ
jgi:hypothetical protein